MRRLLLPALAAVVITAAACTNASGPPIPPDSPESGEYLAPEPQPSVGVQLFQYNWRSVAKQCSDVLGPNHFDFVLLSPAQEHIQGDTWWTSYQPVSYQIESKLGTRDEFQQMVKTCHDNNVRVIADAVINHMAGIDGGTGVAGTDFQHYDYPGLYGHDDFHHCGLTPDDDIQNYSDQQQLQECELSNLSDLRTSEPHVQEKIAGLLNDFRSMGVDGFRIDAAKHMSHRDVEEIVARIDGDPIIVSEIIRATNEPAQPEDYLDVGSVFAFGWSRDLAGMVQGGSLRLAVDLRDGQVPSEQAWTFVSNHDTERGGQHLNPRDVEEFRLAEMLMLAVDYGTPVLYSGYAFDDRDMGAPQTDGKVDDVVCATSDEPAEGEFRCVDPKLAALAKWRAQVGDAPIEHQFSEKSVLAFDRGELGLVALSSHSAEEQTVELTTNLPDGRYRDVLSDDAEVEVKDGKVTVTVPPMGGVALHVGERSVG